MSSMPRLPKSSNPRTCSTRGTAATKIWGDRATETAILWARTCTSSTAPEPQARRKPDTKGEHQHRTMSTQELYDLAVIGGGVNGTGIARDAQGRGLKTLLVEAKDFASGTSSASTKLIHGGLRYLETYE